ncbi:hypothetical protein KEM48_010892 [Puccinia striiformis f. sp. tritici PST-130]|nr:hypothetical protein KEM48_010892 [Puccinia striiformis f. sp. tritici PST-130]
MKAPGPMIDPTLWVGTAQTLFVEVSFDWWRPHALASPVAFTQTFANFYIAFSIATSIFRVRAVGPSIACRYERLVITHNPFNNLCDKNQEEPDENPETYHNNTDCEQVILDFNLNEEEETISDDEEQELHPVESSGIDDELTMESIILFDNHDDDDHHLKEAQQNRSLSSHQTVNGVTEPSPLDEEEGAEQEEAESSSMMRIDNKLLIKILITWNNSMIPAMAAQTLSDTLDSMPNEESWTRVTIIAVDSSSIFFSLTANSSESSMLVVGDVEDVSLPIFQAFTYKLISHIAGYHWQLLEQAKIPLATPLQANSSLATHSADQEATSSASQEATPSSKLGACWRLFWKAKSLLATLLESQELACDSLSKLRARWRLLQQAASSLATTSASCELAGDYFSKLRARWQLLQQAVSLLATTSASCKLAGNYFSKLQACWQLFMEAKSLLATPSAS